MMGKRIIQLFFVLRLQEQIIIISSTMQVRRLLGTREKTQQFFQMVQAGDIALFDILREAIAVFGFTKVGKTSSCHMVCGSPLRAQLQNGQFIYKPSTDRFKQARVGLTTDSQTEIPNIFEAKVRVKGSNPPRFQKVFVLDQPGYGDTYGFHRIFSNGYFHYRTFSKTPKLKFVLAISANDLTGTAQLFKRTIFNFCNTFNDWDSVKADVLKAISLLITKATPKSKLQTFKQILTNLRNSTGSMGAKLIAKYQSIIDEVIKTNRIYFIQKPSAVDQRSPESTILQQIYDNSEFWERPIEKNVVQMQHINFSVGKEVMNKLRDCDQDNNPFHQQFQDFMKQMQHRTNQIIIDHKASFINIVMTIQKDAVTSSQSRQFLDHMQEFNEEYYKFFKSFSDKRQVTEINLFKTAEGSQSVIQTNQQLAQEMKSAYFIKKFKVIEYLQNLNQELFSPSEIFESGTTIRTIEELENFSSLFIGIFRKISILRVPQNNSDKIIYRYSYIIQRLIQESKILTLTLFSNEAAKQQSQKFFTEDVFRIIKDRFISQVIGEIKTNELKEQFINTIDFDNLSNINEQTITFFQSIENKPEQIQIKIAQLIIRFSESIFANNRIPSDEAKKFSASKLFEYRNKFYAYIRNLEIEGINKSSRQQIVELIVQMTNLLANILQTFNSFEEARECYRSINDAQSVFDMYQRELRTFTEPERQRKLLLKYAEEANAFYRRELALKCLQKAYSLSKTYIDMKHVSQMIIEFSVQKRDQKDDDSYLSRFYNENFCSDFSQDLRDTIVILLEY